MTPHTVLGIDFGMSTTIVAAYESGTGNDPVILTIGGSRIIPTVIIVGPGENEVGDIGKHALDRIKDLGAGAANQRTFLNFKRDIGSPKEYHAPWGTIRAEDLCSLFLREVRKSVEALYGGVPLTEGDFSVRMGCPVHWGDRQVRALSQAAQDAGFPNPEIMPEPLGAAIYHRARRQDYHFSLDKQVLIVDLGGSTTDLSIMTVEALKVPFPRPLSGASIGGVDFDQAVAAFIEQEFLTRTQSQQLGEGERAVIHALAREMKEALSDYVQNGKERDVTRSYYSRARNCVIDLKLRRDQFESRTKRVRLQLLDFLKRALQDGHISPQCLSKVILAGGTAQLYLAKNLVCEALPGLKPDRISVDPNPQAVIAKGLSCSKEWVPQVVDDLGAELRTQIMQKVDEYGAKVLSRALEHRLLVVVREAVKEIWAQVSVAEILYYEVSPFEEVRHCPSVRRITDAVGPAYKKRLDLELECLSSQYQASVAHLIQEFARMFADQIKMVCGPVVRIDSMREIIRRNILGKVFDAAIMGQMFLPKGLFPFLPVLTLIIVTIVPLVRATLFNVPAGPERLTQLLMRDLGIREPVGHDDYGGFVYQVWHGAPGFEGIKSQWQKVYDKIWLGYNDSVALRDVFIQSVLRAAPLDADAPKSNRDAYKGGQSG